MTADVIVSVLVRGRSSSLLPWAREMTEAMADSEFRPGPSLQMAIELTSWASGYTLWELSDLGPHLQDAWRGGVRDDLEAVSTPFRASVVLAAALGVRFASLPTTRVWVRDFTDWIWRLGTLLLLDLRVLQEARHYAVFAMGAPGTTHWASVFRGPLVTILSILRNAMHDPRRLAERSRSPRGAHGAADAVVQTQPARPLAPDWRSDATMPRRPEVVHPPRTQPRELPLGPGRTGTGTAASGRPASQRGTEPEPPTTPSRLTGQEDLALCLTLPIAREE